MISAFFADECYSEIYRDVAPVGALQVADAMGGDPERVTIFHSLSKRSNLPGLRSGFCRRVGPKTIAALKQLRDFAGAPMPLPLQRVATAVWADEAHVIANRAHCMLRNTTPLIRFFEGLNGYASPQAGFFLWLPVDDGEAAALSLWQETGVPGTPGCPTSAET